MWIGRIKKIAHPQIQIILKENICFKRMFMKISFLFFGFVFDQSKRQSKSSFRNSLSNVRINLSLCTF